MKKIICVISIIAVLLSLCACSKKEDSSGADSEDVTTVEEDAGDTKVKKNI